MKTTFIGIVCAKGGVGKTTTAINLTSALNQFGRHVVLVDGNYTKPNVGLMLGITKVDSTLHHTLRGEEEIIDSVYAHPSGINVVPGSILYEDLHQNCAKSLSDAVFSLRGKTELVIVDAGPGFSQELNDVLEIVDTVIIVTTPDLSSVTDALKTKRYCKEKGVEIIGALVTHTTDAKYTSSLSDIECILETNVIGEIPYDEAVKVSQHKKYPVVFCDEDSKSAIGYKKLAANLIGEKYEPEDEMGVVDYMLHRLGFR